MSERLLLELEGGGRPPAELPRAGTLVLGSSKERAGFVLEGGGVGGVHAAIGRAKGGGWAIRDLGSAAGTKLNGKKIDAARLQAGDRIELGTLKLRIVDPANPQAAPAAPSAPSDTAAIELVDTPPRGIAPVTAEPPAAAALPPLPGYKLEKRIGRGGMGEVYLAVQERLARPVAIKVLAPKLAADAQFVQRFEAEARAAAALNHPNVVTVYDVGLHAGVHYLSMEYMDRGTLEERVQKEGRLPWKAVLEILRDAGSGLAYAESRGIVHRDLKPANLMQNHAGATKIADLGLATHVEAEERASADQKVFGTAHFMAPEQARGEKVDQRCDLYALGATAYRLLTAHTPYEGATSRDILRALLREEPRPIAGFAPDVPPEMIEIVARLMRKDLAQRTGSANVLLKELEALRSASAAPVSAAAPARSSKGMLVGLVIVVGGAAAFFALRGKHETPAEPPRPPEPALVQHSPPPKTDPVTPTPAPPVEPQPNHATPETAVTKPAHENDERELELFETKARVALLEITSKQLEPAERISALREMAQKFNGTTSATEAGEKASALEQELAHADEAAATRHAALLSLATQLRAAAELDLTPPAPGRSILAMRAVPGQEPFANDPVFEGELTRIQQELFGKSADYAKSVLEDTQKDLDKGDQAAAKAKLTALMPLFDLPEFPLGQAPVGADVLFELQRRARERLTNLGLIATQIQTQQSREETLALAQALSGPDALERELGTLDLEKARARVEALLGKTGTPSSKTMLTNLQAEIAGASRAFALLAREYQGGWRRKGVDDPRDKSEALHNAVGADAQGLMLEAAAGGVERVPWTAFGRNSKALAHLFAERLAREYNADESRDVMGLMHLTAVAEALDAAGKMFDPGRKANFTAGNALEMLDGFTLAQVWSTKAGGALPLLDEDQAAAQLLAKVLQDTTDGAWSSAIAGAERLLKEHQDSLIVRMMSDGSEPSK